MTPEPESDADAPARRLSDTLDRLAGNAGSLDPSARGDDALSVALLSRLRAPATWSGPPERLRLQILAAARAERT